MIHKKRWLVAGFLVILTLLPLGAVAAQDGEPDPEDVLAEAERVLAEAERALGIASEVSAQSNQVLDFVQAAVIIAGVVGTLGGLLVNRRFSDLDKELERVTAIRDEAEAMLRDIRAQNTDATRALQLVQLGENQLRTGNLSEALGTFSAAHTLAPDNETTNYFLGELYVLQRDLDQALFHLDKALEVSPEFAPAIASRGFALRLQGDRATTQDERDRLYAQAEGDILRALGTNPRLLNAERQSLWATLGGHYRRQNRLEKAADAYERATQVTPSSSWAVGGVATCNALLGNVDKATTFYERSRTLAERRLAENQGDFWAWSDKAIADLYLGNSREALDAYSRVVEHTDTIAPLESAVRALEDLRDLQPPLAGVGEAIDLLSNAMGEYA